MIFGKAPRQPSLGPSCGGLCFYQLVDDNCMSQIDKYDKWWASEILEATPWIISSVQNACFGSLAPSRRIMPTQKPAKLAIVQ